MKRTFLTTLTIGFLVAQSIFVTATAHAAPAGLYFNPTSGTIAQDATFTVQLRLNNTNASNVESSFKYDPARLAITAKQTTGTDFTTTAQYDNATGSATVTGTGGATGTADKFVAGFTFKALAAGSVTLKFTGTNQTSTGLLGTGLLSSPTASPTTNATYTILDQTSATTPTIPSTTTPATGTSSTSGSTAPSPSSSTTNTVPSRVAPDANGHSQTQPRVESHQEEVEGVYSRVTGEDSDTAIIATQTASHTAMLSTTTLIGSIVATLLAISLYFIYRGYRLTHLKQWFIHETVLVLAFDPRDTADPRTAKESFIKHIATALKLITYHPIKLLESGLPKQQVPFSKRRSAK